MSARRWSYRFYPKVEKYLSQVAGLRSRTLLEVEKVEAKFDSGASERKLILEPKLKKQLDQIFMDNNLDSAIEITAGIEEFSNYQADLSDGLARMKFQNGTVKEFLNQLQFLRN
ncbi:hypothetical protein N9043_01190 [bacterium]|nr:hypothetical protein [Mariniblastus sp.]MDB4461544.1 hypothetical protein [bacterium]